MNFYKKQKEIKEQMLKDAIYEAAVTIILNKGYDNLTMQYVAQQVGIATGTIYNYFTNKAELFFYIYERLQDSIAEKMDLIVNKKGGSLELLKEYLNTAISFCAEYRIIIEIARQLGMWPKKSNMPKLVISQIQQIIDKGIAQKEIFCLDSIKAAKFVFLNLVGYSELSFHHENTEVLLHPNELIEVINVYLQLKIK